MAPHFANYSQSARASDAAALILSAGANRYAFDFGGGPEFIVVDGTDQPGLDGRTLAVTAEAPRVWRVVRKQNGRMQISAIWTLSPDGDSPRDDFTGYPSNGSNFTIHYIYTPIEEPHQRLALKLGGRAIRRDDES